MSTNMRRDEALAECEQLPGAVEDYPFGDEVAVFKVGGKMFALITMGEDPSRLSLKCDPELALELRARLPAVTAGYHLNKKHWNTVLLDGSVDDGEIVEMIEHSYDLIVASLPRAQRSLYAR